MAIDGTSIKEMKLWDEDTMGYVKINLTVRDIVYFKLLMKLEKAVRSIKLQT